MCSSELRWVLGVLMEDRTNLDCRWLLSTGEVLLGIHDQSASLPLPGDTLRDECWGLGMQHRRAGFTLDSQPALRGVDRS